MTTIIRTLMVILLALLLCLVYRQLREIWKWP